MWEISGDIYIARISCAPKIILYIAKLVGGSAAILKGYGLLK